MFRRSKDLAQLARLENALQRLDSAKYLLWESGEPMLAAQVSALLEKARLELKRAQSSGNRPVNPMAAAAEAQV